MYGPTPRGQLTLLRPPRLEEAAIMAGWFEDLEVTATILRRFPPGLGEEEDWLRRTATDPDSIFWAVELEGRLVGATGVHDIDWHNGHGTTGLILGDKSVWGRGLAREVMSVRTRFLFGETTLRSPRSGYLDGNEASRRAQAARMYSTSAGSGVPNVGAPDCIDIDDANDPNTTGASFTVQPANQPDATSTLGRTTGSTFSRSSPKSSDAS